jgi:hypothetical protein
MYLIKNIEIQKMSPTYEQNKKHIYKYRESRLEEHKAYSREWNAKNKEKVNKANLGNYHYKKQCQIFRNILIADF